LRNTGLSAEALAKAEGVAHPHLGPPPSRGRKNKVGNLLLAVDAVLLWAA
jgi:hypothetical protein